jgi:hypothetical protein
MGHGLSCKDREPGGDWPMNAAAAGTSAVQVWTLVIAALAIVGTTVSAILLRRTGKGTVRAAEKAADASERSAAAAEKSAQAAQDAVGVSRETAAGVADRAEADALTTRYQEAAAQAAGPANPGLAGGGFAGHSPRKPRAGAAGSPHHVVFVAEEQVEDGHDDGAARERPRWTGAAGLRTCAGPGAPAPVTWFKQSCKPVITLRYEVRPTPISGVRRASSWQEVHRDERSVAGQCHGTA